MNSLLFSFNDAFSRAKKSDSWLSFKKARGAQVAAVVFIVFILSALFAPLISPTDPFDLASISLLDASTPPAWVEGGSSQFLLGTDDQGRDMLSAIIHGAKISIFVGLVATLLSAVIGVSLGLLSAYVGGRLDAFLMRIADVQLSFPAILVALLADGLARAVIPNASHEAIALYVIVFAIALSKWVDYARTVRGAAMVEKQREYVQAAQIIGLKPRTIAIRHILPNTLSPILVIATINLAIAVITEATLSYLGLGMPPTTPSLGTLIRIGNDYLFSGEWWISIFPGIALVLLALSANHLGDWMRDAFNPKLH